MADISKIKTLDGTTYNIKDATARDTFSTIPRPNLLDNWYFVGGGSQLGNGAFPINDIGKTYYSGDYSEAINNWWIRGSMTCTIAADGLHLTPGILYQMVSSPSSLRGKTVTISAIINGELVYQTGTIPSNIPAQNTVVIGNNSSRFTVRALTNGCLEANIVAKDQETLVIQAAKLELGDTQTLAHLVNGVWVLNAVPSYGVELAKGRTAYTGRIPKGSVSIIGDSISTFKDNRYIYSEYYSNNTHYPYNNGTYDAGVNYPSDCWWYKVIEASGAQLLVNASYSGSCVTTAKGTDRPTFYQRCTTSIIGEPDTVIVALGTNDSIAAHPPALGDYDYTTTYTSLSEDQFRPAYIKGMKALKAILPNCKIIAVILKMDDIYKDSIVSICSTLGIECVECRDYAGDASGVHPDNWGMRQVASAFLAGDDATSVRKGQYDNITLTLPDNPSYTVGTLNATRWGNIVIVNMTNLHPNGYVTTWDNDICSGLPEPVNMYNLQVSPTASAADTPSGNDVRLRIITESGVTKLQYARGGAYNYTTSLVYICK